MSDQPGPRSIVELLTFAQAVVDGRPHTKKESADFFKDLVSAVGPDAPCPIRVSREGNNSIFLDSSANRFYTLVQARALAYELLRVAG